MLKNVVRGNKNTNKVIFHQSFYVGTKGFPYDFKNEYKMAIMRKIPKNLITLVKLLHLTGC